MEAKIAWWRIACIEKTDGTKDTDGTKGTDPLIEDN